MARLSIRANLSQTSTRLIKPASTRAPPPPPLLRRRTKNRPWSKEPSWENPTINPRCLRAAQWMNRPRARRLIKNQRELLPLYTLTLSLSLALRIVERTWNASPMKIRAACNSNLLATYTRCTCGLIQRGAMPDTERARLRFLRERAS